MLREVEHAGTAVPVTRAAVEELLRRRRELHPDDRRIVTQFQVTEKPGGGFHLFAASVGLKGDDPSGVSRGPERFVRDFS